MALISKKFLFWVLVLTTVFSLALAKGAKEESIKLAEVPKEIKAAALKKVKGLRMISVKRITKGKKITYEVKGVADNTGYEMLISEKGRVRKLEKEDSIPILVSKLPERVRRAAVNKIKGLKITEAEMETKRGKKIYEVEGIAKGRKYELKIDAIGKVLEVEDEGKVDDGDSDSDSDSDTD